MSPSSPLRNQAACSKSFDDGQVQSIPERDRHEFRKDMKTMRYLAEFFDLHFPGLQQEPFRSDFRDIQDALGKVNDHYVVLRIEGRKPPVKVPSEVKQAIDDAEILWARLSAAKVPWGDQATRRP